LDERAVFVGKTPGKVIFSRPVMNPENSGWDPEYATFVATDLLSRGHRVFALEPWYWNDHGRSFETMLQTGGRTYWTDTGVVVLCGCGEFARFYELHRTNATLAGVARVEPGSFEEAPDGLRTAAQRALFYPERALHIRMGLAQTGGVRVTVAYEDGPPASYELGFWNLPLDQPKNRHAVHAFATSGTGETREATFLVPAGEVANGALYVEGPPGLVVRALEAEEA
ncbi:MAG TPA: hypothetical protein VHH36_07705, partial [Candidatus Thermoplasmatota archaeon]|nr:hypothetical protein [Candidatus Thermoplasmatota archaeon]